MDFTTLTNNVSSALDSVGLYAVDQNIFIRNNGKKYSSFTELVKDIKLKKCFVYLDVACLIGNTAWIPTEPLVSTSFNDFMGINAEGFDDFYDWLRETLQIDLEDDGSQEGSTEEEGS